MIAFWYKTYIRRFGEGAEKNEKKVKLLPSTTKRSHFFIPWPIPPPPSQAEVDCGVFEVYKQADSLKWAARLHWPCLTPPQKSVDFSPIFCCYIQSRLSVPHLIRRPKRYPTVNCGMVDFLTGIAGPIRARRHSTRHSSPASLSRTLSPSLFSPKMSLRIAR